MANLEVLIDQQKIQNRVVQVADEINQTYSTVSEESPLLVGVVLRGAFVFASDLVRELHVPCEIDFLELSSYDGSESTGEVHWHKDFRSNVQGRDLLIIEDIVDTGLTMKALKEILKHRGAKSFRLCSLLSKPSRRKTEVEIDFLGFEIEDKFVVGYGLDFDQGFRNLKDICLVQNP